jgi:putative peptide maturation system protein
MKETLQQALIDAFDYLMTSTLEGARPEEARARFRLFHEQHPKTEMELIWEEEPYDRSIHYDILFHLAGEGTVSLAFSPERSLPWPMRGVQRLNEGDLVRVNNVLLNVSQAIVCLDFIWGEARIINRLVDACLIQEVLDKDPIQLSETELQFAMDGFRRAHKLYRAEDTRRWMERYGMTHKQLEHYIADEAIIVKLRDRITARHIEDYFETHRPDFETARIARIEFGDKDSAARAIERIRTDEEDFYEVAQRNFLSRTERSETAPGEIFAIIRRSQEPSELEAAVFAAAPGEALGPIRSADGYSVIRVLSFTPPRLDEPTRNTIKKILFEEWLEERRRAARIEWFWGNANMTSRTASTNGTGVSISSAVNKDEK